MSMHARNLGPAPQMARPYTPTLTWINYCACAMVLVHSHLSCSPQHRESYIYNISIAQEYRYYQILPVRYLPVLEKNQALTIERM
jgi:hypothetical protein